jgi:hypothetical protein
MIDIALGIVLGVGTLYAIRGVFRFVRCHSVLFVGALCLLGAVGFVWFTINRGYWGVLLTFATGAIVTLINNIGRPASSPNP